MLVLITYDVNTETPAGRTRLRRIAKICQNYGQRVQCSVFECQVDATQLKMVQALLLAEYDPKLDSLRIYTLGNMYLGRVQHFGVKPSFDVAKDALIV